jgi:hypothetical protein
LVCLDWKSDSLSYRTHLPFDSKVATPPVFGPGDLCSRAATSERGFGAEPVAKFIVGDRRGASFASAKRGSEGRIHNPTG